MKLTWKEENFIWTNDCKWSFKSLKEKLTLTPVLSLPIVFEDFVVYTNVLGIRLGSVLMQRDKIITYSWRQL